jgi:hypothetical protein
MRKILKQKIKRIKDTEIKEVNTGKIDKYLDLKTIDKVLEQGRENDKAMKAAKKVNFSPRVRNKE